jgi:hypothetical protein
MAEEVAVKLLMTADATVAFCTPSVLILEVVETRLLMTADATVAF